MNGIAVEARNLTRKIQGAVEAVLVENIDVAFMRGEFTAVTGPSGSGKSSLLYLLGLLDTPTSGTVRIGGRDTAELSSPERARLRLSEIGFVFQFHFLLPEFTALENVLIPMRKLGKFRGGDAKERALALLDGLGVSSEKDKTPDRMSGGQRQRVAIARALANDPPLLLADEPTGNLDSKNAELVFRIFEDIAHRQNRTVIAVTHETNLARRADRRIHLIDGHIDRDGDPAGPDEP